jgi:hypothetical protein
MGVKKVEKRSTNVQRATAHWNFDGVMLLIDIERPPRPLRTGQRSPRGT